MVKEGSKKTFWVMVLSFALSYNILYASGTHNLIIHAAITNEVLFTVTSVMLQFLAILLSYTLVQNNLKSGGCIHHFYTEELKIIRVLPILTVIPLFLLNLGLLETNIAMLLTIPGVFAILTYINISLQVGFFVMRDIGEHINITNLMLNKSIITKTVNVLAALSFYVISILVDESILYIFVFVLIGYTIYKEKKIIKETQENYKYVYKDCEHVGYFKRLYTIIKEEILDLRFFNKISSNAKYIIISNMIQNAGFIATLVEFIYLVDIFNVKAKDFFLFMLIRVVTELLVTYIMKKIKLPKAKSILNLSRSLGSVFTYGLLLFGPRSYITVLVVMLNRGVVTALVTYSKEKVLVDYLTKEEGKDIFSKVRLTQSLIATIVSLLAIPIVGSSSYSIIMLLPIFLGFLSVKVLNKIKDINK